jgi:hypothetical protein
MNATDRVLWRFFAVLAIVTLIGVWVSVAKPKPPAEPEKPFVTAFEAGEYRRALAELRSVGFIKGPLEVHDGVAGRRFAVVYVGDEFMRELSFEQKRNMATMASTIASEGAYSSNVIFYDWRTQNVVATFSDGSLDVK